MFCVISLQAYYATYACSSWLPGQAGSSVKNLFSKIWALSAANGRFFDALSNHIKLLSIAVAVVAEWHTPRAEIC